MHKKTQAPKPCIVVVDDDRATRFLTSESLFREGYDVYQGDNGQDAVELFGWTECFEALLGFAEKSSGLSPRVT